MEGKEFYMSCSSLSKFIFPGYNFEYTCLNFLQGKMFSSKAFDRDSSPVRINCGFALMLKREPRSSVYAPPFPILENYNIPRIITSLRTTSLLHTAPTYSGSTKRSGSQGKSVGPNLSRVL